MPTQYESIVDLAAVLLSGITDIGAVYKEMKYAKEEVSFKNLFKVSINGKDQIRGWMITSPRQLRKPGPTKGFVFDDIQLLFMGYAQVNQGVGTATGSERLFYALTEIIADTFDSYIKLNDPLNASSLIADSLVTQIRKRSYVKLADVLCHYAEIEKIVTVQRQFNI